MVPSEKFVGVASNVEFGVLPYELNNEWPNNVLLLLVAVVVVVVRENELE